MEGSVSNLSVVANNLRPLTRYVGAPVGCLDASRKLFVLTLPGLLKPFVTGHPHGLFDPGAAGKRMAYASGMSPFSHEGATATTHCVAATPRRECTPVWGPRADPALPAPAATEALQEGARPPGHGGLREAPDCTTGSPR